MDKSLATTALLSLEELLADLELNRIPLVNCYMKACRIARLTGDSDNLDIFQYELSGYTSGPRGIPSHIWDLCKRAGRVYKVKNDDNQGDKEVSYTDSIEQIQTHIETAKTRLEFNRPQSVSITSANPSQYVQAPMRNVPLENNLSNTISTWTGRLSSRRQFLYSYCLGRYFELQISSAAEDIFESYRTVVDRNIGNILPDEIKKFDSISKNIKSDNSEDWANAVHTCRRLLQELADKLYPPSAKPITHSSGKIIKIGNDNYINRLILYCESKSDSGVFDSVVGSQLAFLGDRLDSIFSASQKGSHANVSLIEAKRYIIYCYMLVGDILSLGNVAEAPLKAQEEAVVEVEEAPLQKKRAVRKAVSAE